MDQFQRKTAFASGIGLALCRAFGQRGMNVAVADVEAAACAQAVETLRSEGIQAVGMACDVPDHESLAGAAARAFTEFGNVHILCNNAGVSRAGPIETIAASDWDWVIGVNLNGLVWCDRAAEHVTLAAKMPRVTFTYHIQMTIRHWQIS
jgi:NAD(P)-dependent dehydrogenase (short-subunit alcohol dehydrogenase family)